MRGQRGSSRSMRRIPLGQGEKSPCEWMRLRNVLQTLIFAANPAAGGAMLASPCRAAAVRGQGPSGLRACLGNWRLHAKRAGLNCFKCISLPLLHLSLSPKVVHDLKPAHLDNTFLPRGVPRILFLFIYYFIIFSMLFGQRLLSSSHYFHFLL